MVKSAWCQIRVDLSIEIVKLGVSGIEMITEGNLRTRASCDAILIGFAGGREQGPFASRFRKRAIPLLQAGFEEIEI